MPPDETEYLWKKSEPLIEQIKFVKSIRPHNDMSDSQTEYFDLGLPC